MPRWTGPQGSTYDGDYSFLDNHPLVNPATKKIRELDMERHLLNIEHYGFSVMPPEEVDPTGDLPKRLLEAILRIAKEATGVEHNVETGEMGELPVAGQQKGKNGEPSQYLLYSLMGKDRAFEEAVMHPKLLAIMEYYLGIDCQLNICASFIKKGDETHDPKNLNIGLHVDPHGGGSHGHNNAMMALSSPYPHVFNSAWCLTDYSKDNGPIAIVPGSHKMLRRPQYEHGEERAAMKHAIPVEARAGSLIFFHGNVWHGAFPKTTKGLRVNLTTYYCGAHFKPQESYRHLDPEIVARNPKRFAELLGWNEPWGFNDNRGPVPFKDRQTANGGMPFVAGVEEGAAQSVYKVKLDVEGQGRLSGQELSPSSEPAVEAKL